MVENALGLSHAQRAVAGPSIGVDGLRIDAGRHLRGGFSITSISRLPHDRRCSTAARSMFTPTAKIYDESRLLSALQKDINDTNLGQIGGNRDALDFNLYFVMKENLEQAGVTDAWNRIRRAGLDLADDRLRNGSAGVTFTHNHDVFRPFALENVAQAFTLMMPGNTAVYFNGQRVW